MKGKETPPPYPNGIYGAYMDSQRMIRKDGYKLMVYPKIKKLLLFDLKNDPGEVQNLAPAKEHQCKKQSLRRELGDFLAQTNDPLLADWQSSPSTVV